MIDTMTLQDIPAIPDLSAFAQEEQTPFEAGWYKGTILAERRFTDKNGNERVFETNDTPAQRSGRNLRLQVEITRASDGRKLNISWLVNYNPENLTPEVISQVLEAKESGGQYGDLFPAFMTLTRLQKLQALAGVKTLSGDGQGGLDLSPIFNKEGYFRIAPDERNPQYMTVKDVRPSSAKPKQTL